VLLKVPQVLSAEQLLFIRQQLAAVDWQDGRHSAGYLSRSVKNNNQLPDNHPVALQLGEMILKALDANSLFAAAALPAKLMPPLFNRYHSGQHYGRHIDGAVRPVSGFDLRIRTDLSVTLFLSEPDDYEGGDLVIEDTFGARSIKLPAGDMVLYPGTTVHHVRPVTRGERLAAFFWVQSMVRDDHQRSILLQLDNAIQQIANEHPGQSSLTDLAGVYHNLLRRWADV
jgi:PKHD-type hydroxylase